MSKPFDIAKSTAFSAIYELSEDQIAHTPKNIPDEQDYSNHLQIIDSLHYCNTTLRIISTQRWMG